jgi:hypothetical protein
MLKVMLEREFPTFSFAPFSDCILMGFFFLLCVCFELFHTQCLISIVVDFFFCSGTCEWYSSGKFVGSRFRMLDNFGVFGVMKTSLLRDYETWQKVLEKI